ncbi:hypothetical protein Tco_1108398 [Tanacetum coccineum]
MLDRTDFASWQQRIRLYCWGKENEVNIMKSIDEGPFQMGTFRETLVEGNEGALHLGSELTKEDRESQLYDDFEHFCQNKGETIYDYYVRFVTVVKLNRGLRDSNYDQLYAPENGVNILKSIDEGPFQMGRFRETLAEGNEGALHLGPERPRVYTDLSPKDKERESQLYDDFEHFRQNKGETIHDYYGRQNRGQGNNAWGAGAASYGGLRTELGMQIQVKQCRLSATTATNRVALNEEQLLFITGVHDNVVDEDVDEQPVQDLALNVDNMFQADDYDAFDSDVDEAPTAQTMFMADLSSADPVYNEAGPSCDSDILSEVHDNDHYQDAVCEHHEVHEMHDDVQPNYIVNLHADYTSDSNMIPYDQYVKDNAVSVVQINVSYVPNDAYMMILNDMHEQPAQYASVTTQNNVVDKSLTDELTTYKEQVELYERRAKFELTEREQKIDEQLRIVITGRNIKEENLKRELHS